MSYYLRYTPTPTYSLKPVGVSTGVPVCAFADKPDQGHNAAGNRVSGPWPCHSSKSLEEWLDEKIALVEHPSRQSVALHPVIQEFKHFIESEPAIYMGFHQMFEQIPNKHRYAKDPSGKPQVRL